MSLDKLLKLIPVYIDQLLRLVSRPRHFLGGLDHEDSKTLQAALLFLLNSAILAYVLRVPFLDLEDAASYGRIAISTVVLCLPTAIILAIVAFGSCRMVGGRAPLQAHVSISSYIAGISTLIFVMTVLIAKGLIKSEMPDQITLYNEYMNKHFPNIEVLKEANFEALNEGVTLEVSILILLGGLSLLTLWVLNAWRTYWDLNQISGVRAIVALIFFLVIGYGVNWALSLAQFAQDLHVF